LVLGLNGARVNFGNCFGQLEGVNSTNKPLERFLIHTVLSIYLIFVS